MRVQRTTERTRGNRNIIILKVKKFNNYQGDEVEQRDVNGEHDEVHRRIPGQTEGALGDLIGSSQVSQYVVSCENVLYCSVYCIKSELTMTWQKKYNKCVAVYHSKSRDAACFDVSQQQPRMYHQCRIDLRETSPGRAVAHGKGPAAEDDPLGSTEGTDVLKVKVVGRLSVCQHLLPAPSWDDRQRCISPQ